MMNDEKTNTEGGTPQAGTGFDKVTTNDIEVTLDESKEEIGGLKSEVIHDLSADIQKKLNSWLAGKNIEIVSTSMSTHVVPNQRDRELLMPYTNILIIYKELQEKPDMSGLFNPGSGVKRGSTSRAVPTEEV
jgi:hypothetical protein